MDPIFSRQPTTIFEIMSGLARETGAINLGQGFPDSEGPYDVRAKAAESVLSGPNQYPPMAGLPELRAAIAAHYARFQNLALDPMTETLVTSGATEALAAAIFGLVSPGDEVILIQPLYDAYLPLVLRAGGVPKLVRQSPPDWRITRKALEAAASPRTRFLLLNNPQNPTARVFNRTELQVIADFCIARGLVAICDEVWEHLTFDGRAHQTLMTLDGMRNRCVKIGSAGKMFSLTGWKVGLLCACPALLAAAAKAHQFLTFTTAPNLQLAVAYGLAKDADYFQRMREDFARSRDRLTAGLQDIGYHTLPSEGTYFVPVDLARSGIALDDSEFCLRAVRDYGIAAIPLSAFYAEEAVTSVIRLCFAKKDSTLDAALDRLDKARRMPR